MLGKVETDAISNFLVTSVHPRASINGLYDLPNPHVHCRFESFQWNYTHVCVQF